MKAKVERMVGLTDAVIRAGTERFVVMLSSGDSWDGVKPKVFTVVGSRSVRLQGGAVTLPELVLTSTRVATRDDPPRGYAVWSSMSKPYLGGSTSQPGSQQ